MEIRKKHVLLAGYGNIARAFEKIMNEQENHSSFKLSVCDIKNGDDIMEFLPLHYKDYDLVLNTSLANSIRLSEMCAELGIDYIDVGIEEGADDVSPSYDYVNLMKEILKLKTPKCKLMLGFGINPGILEHVYQKYKPNEKHYAFELEHDNSLSDDNQIFGTWSPFMYVEESVFSEKMLVKKESENTRVVEMNKSLEEQGGVIVLKYKNIEKKYIPVCHEELITMSLSDSNLMGTGYLFQAPQRMQEYCLNKGCRITHEEMLDIPVLSNLKGDDQVGILFWDTKNKIYWIKNVTENKSTWKRYGINSVCWQTATGAWIAYKMIDKMKCDHPHTMTEVSQIFPNEIDSLLEQIGLYFEREDDVYDVEEFKNNVIKFIS